MSKHWDFTCQTFGKNKSRRLRQYYTKGKMWKKERCKREINIPMVKKSYYVLLILPFSCININKRNSPFPQEHSKILPFTKECHDESFELGRCIDGDISLQWQLLWKNVSHLMDGSPLVLSCCDKHCSRWKLGEESNVTLRFEQEKWNKEKYSCSSPHQMWCIWLDL